MVMEKMETGLKEELLVNREWEHCKWWFTQVFLLAYSADIVYSLKVRLRVNL